MAERLTFADGFVSFDDVMNRPVDVVAYLGSSAAVYGIREIGLTRDRPEYKRLELTLEPWAEPAAEDYPVERVAISVTSTAAIRADPIDTTGRRWKHRNPARLPGSVASPLPTGLRARLGSVLDLAPLQGELCLWYPGDPPELKWEWNQGLVNYITIVHRHLQAEECWRRTSTWPAEDAPHGRGTHPLRTQRMRVAAAELRAS